MQNRNVIFYGAGEDGALLFNKASAAVFPGKAVAFVDKDIYKQGHAFMGLPVLAWEDAKAQYGDNFDIYVTASNQTAPEIIGFLIENNVHQERIINYEPVHKRLGCWSAESDFAFRAIGDKIYFRNCITVVLNRAFIGADERKYKDIPVDYKLATQPDVLKQVIETMRNNVKKIQNGESENIHSHCINYRNRYYFDELKVRIVNFSGASACNFSCSYCFQRLRPWEYPSPKFDAYDMYISALKLLEENGYIDDKVTIEINSGEFSISKSGNRLIEFASNYPLRLFTNAFVYSNAAAASLEKFGMLFVSVDAGTDETFKLVKGVDGKEQVFNNLRQYAKHGPITLKYILLDGINDTQADLEGFFELADEVAVRVDLTRDFMNPDTIFSDRALEWAAKFIEHFRGTGKLNMAFDTFARGDEKIRLKTLLLQ